MSDDQVSLPVAVLVIVLVCVAIGLATLGDVMIHSHGPDLAAHAVGTLKTFNTGPALFREGDKDQDGNFDYGTLRELSDAGLVDAVTGSGTKLGYLYAVQPAPATSEFLWAATASPERPSDTGDRYFMINQAGVVWYRLDAPFPLRDDCGVDPQGMPLGEPDGFSACATCGEPIREPGWKTLSGGAGSGDPLGTDYVCATCPAPAADDPAGE